MCFFAHKKTPKVFYLTFGVLSFLKAPFGGIVSCLAQKACNFGVDQIFCKLNIVGRFFSHGRILSYGLLQTIHDFSLIIGARTHNSLKIIGLSIGFFNSGQSSFGFAVIFGQNLSQSGVIALLISKGFNGIGIIAFLNVKQTQGSFVIFGTGSLIQIGFDLSCR